ncbi:phage holin [Nocardioides alcanivorans]|uniref:phage holin n=1 Tax=Nocardioides alcanivorans TaxID=2897352 RepID=UPI001F1ADB95|nr:hypothetical protein [Nocardioides alcanivorans]
MSKPTISPAVRDRLYPVALAAVALLGGYGLIADEMIPLWVSLVAAILGTGVATVYRPAKTLSQDGDG